MNFLRKCRFLLRSLMPCALFMGLTAYFLWNAVHGAHGIHAYHQRLKLEQQALQAEKDAQDEQKVWKRRILSLNEHALDPDMLDERVRAMLNLAESGDIVIPYGAHHNLY